MSRKMTYAPLYFVDFKEGCQDLTNEQVGIYLRVLFEIYENMGPIPFDDRRLSKRLNCRPHKAREMVLKLVEMGKLYLTREGWIGNRRAENEIVKFISVSVQKTINGSRPKKNVNRVQSQFNSSSIEVNSVSPAKIVNDFNGTPELPRSYSLHILESREESTSLEGSALSPQEEALEEKRKRSAAAVEAFLKRQAERQSGGKMRGKVG